MIIISYYRWFVNLLSKNFNSINLLYSSAVNYSTKKSKVKEYDKKNIKKC